MDAIFKAYRIKRHFFSLCIGFIFFGYNLCGCAYQLGSVNRSIPGGFKKVSIPVFKNKTQEVGIEVAFTNALIQEFQRSRVAHIVDKSISEVAVVGSIENIQYLPGAKRLSGDSATPYLPSGTALASEYRILLTVTVQVIKQADGVELWKSTFKGERTYQAPQVTLAGVNSVNPLYNLSARRQNIDLMASDIMLEVHDRITENF